VISLLGPNGSGKSTLLKCLNRILKPKIGTILVKERNAKELGLKELARFFAYVPQSAAYAFPSTVFDTVLLGRRPHVHWGVGARDKEIVSQMLVLLDLEDMAFRQFNELSGGERQKVLLARALAQEPEILLLDEPTSNLDLRHQLEVLNLIESLAREKKISAIMAMHDLNLASRFSDKIIMLKEGQVYAVGEPASVLTPENIKSVYGVETILNSDSGKPYIVPLRPV
jgi:iron complex transport system ATP-binding protein